MVPKFKKKLVLNKETVVNLVENEMKEAVGGSVQSLCNDCFTIDTMCAICTYNCTYDCTKTFTHDTLCDICTYDCH